VGLIPVYTKSGFMVGTGYTRIVYGECGDYIEISPEQIIKENIEVPKDKEWKYGHEKVYYIEYRTKDTFAVKIYYQIKVVDYADYKVGFFYVSPRDVRFTHSNSLYSYIEK